MAIFQLESLNHRNVNAFIGACTDYPDICLVWDYGSKGSLQDVIWNDEIPLDDSFKFSMCDDFMKVSVTRFSGSS